MNTLLWHDYETTGTDPRLDRPLQFAALRTDEDLNVVGEPETLYCRPPDDVLPHPEAALITGLAPQVAAERGLAPYDFAARIHELMMEPGSCVVGYNSIRFDDEVTRNLLYRNLFDPYEREWKGGNSRWDLIDVLRLARALRPEGIRWPTRDDGSPSMRLEHLSAANGLEHDAHDALGDVRATLELARLLRRHQPRLLRFAYDHRGKEAARRLLAYRSGRPLLLVSGHIPNVQGNIAPVLPLTGHPGNRNEYLLADLRRDPAELLDLSVEQLAGRMFATREALGDRPRPGVLRVAVNKSPVLAPLNTLSPQAAERLGLDRAVIERRAAALRDQPALADRLRDAVSGRSFDEPDDVDQMIYSGFVSDGDKAILARLRRLSPAARAQQDPRFEDPRLPELWFRHRARSWPETLSDSERERWRDHRRRRLLDSDGGGSIHLAAWRARLTELRREAGAEQRELLDAVSAWGEGLVADLGEGS